MKVFMRAVLCVINGCALLGCHAFGVALNPARLVRAFQVPIRSHADEGFQFFRQLGDGELRDLLITIFVSARPERT